jgi:enoyl-CoA hydratase
VNIKKLDSLNDTSLIIIELKMKRISRMLPQQLHRYMAFSGDMMTAEEMKHFGALLKIVPQDHLRETVLEIASRLLGNPPLTLRGFKAAINTNEDARLVEKYAVEASYTKQMPGTEDFKEAVMSFLEKRKPIYKGC